MIGLVIIAAWFIYFYKIKSRYMSLCIIDSIGSGILTILVLLVCTTPFSQSTDYTESFRTPIVSVQNKESISGSFFLGSGYIGQQQYYFVMQRTGEDEYKPANVNTSDLECIKETNDIKPCVVTYKKKVFNKYWKALLGADIMEQFKYRYVIVVPKGTVIVKYNVN